MELFCAKLESGIMRYCMSEITSSTSVAPQDIVGDEVDWMDAHGYVYIAMQLRQSNAQYQSYVDHVAYLSEMNESLTQQLSHHTAKETQLRKQITTSQIEFDESISSLLEKITTLESQLNPVTVENVRLRREVDIMRNKLIEVESFVNSDDGALLMQMENELAQSKLRLADMECENDDLKVALRKLKTVALGGKENAVNAVYVK